MTRALVYLAGPMTGLKGNNFHAFDAAKIKLIAMGYDVWSPADRDREQGFDGTTEASTQFYQEALRADIKALDKCDYIYLLDGWKDSNGALLEVHYAASVGIPILNPAPPTRIIALAGYARAGKDTAGSFFVGDHGYKRIAFADPLKALALRVNPKLNQTVWSLGGWEKAKAEPGVREFLQELGMAVREELGPDTWVNAALSKVQPGGRYVITDLRFPNEMAAVRKLGGVCVWVGRDGVFPANSHVSEDGITGETFDFHLMNNYTIPVLQRLVADTVRRLKEIPAYAT